MNRGFSLLGDFAICCCRNLVIRKGRKFTIRLLLYQLTPNHFYRLRRINRQFDLLAIQPEPYTHLAIWTIAVVVDYSLLK